MKLILPLIILLLFAGCDEQKQAAKKAAWLISHDRLGGVCNTMFPPHPDSVSVRDTMYKTDTLPGKPIIVRDTVPCNGQTIIREIQCPPPQVINHYYSHDSIVWRDNPYVKAAYEETIRGQNIIIKDKDELINRQQKRIDENNWWKIACIITWCGVLILIIIKLKVK